METMTRQEVFTKGCEHLMTQFEQASDSLAGCAYRLQKGDKMLACAAGGLMTDEAYAKGLEQDGWFNNAGIGNRTAQSVLIASGVSAFDMDLVKHLQFVHDSHEPRMWPHLLILLRDIHDLTLPWSVHQKIIEQEKK